MWLFLASSKFSCLATSFHSDATEAIIKKEPKEEEEEEENETGEEDEEKEGEGKGAEDKALSAEEEWKLQHIEEEKTEPVEKLGRIGWMEKQNPYD